MDAEDYLNEHCKSEDWNNIEDCLKDSILTNNVIEHMEGYAALRIHDVAGRSEQLVAFSKWKEEKGYNPIYDHEGLVKEYLDSNLNT
jgi:hypothetical protein